MGFQGSCPMCGAEIEFTAANSLVVVCGSCSSIVGRGDGKLESYGKVADLVQTDSPLQVGAEGEIKGQHFEITGRTQYRHAQGGVWDEWYIAFRGGERWGWLAEAQGRYYLTFRKQLPENHSVPPLSQLNPDESVMIPSVGAMKVAEIGTAELIAGEGEIPFAFKPGERHLYADLQGPGGKFATLDGSEDPPILFLGGEFPIARLGLELAEAREVVPTSVESQAVTCPNCGGSLELHAPKETERIACPYCDSMLDVEDNGALRFLYALKQSVKPAIPLGVEGELRGRKYTVIGFLRRKVTYEGKIYPWSEYLLYTPRQSFHWLIHSRNHWTLAKPIAAADVQAHVRTAYVDGKMYRAFDRSTSEVTAVYGEFYWKVEVGERVWAADYIRPPFILSREETVEQSESPPTVAANDAPPTHFPKLDLPPVDATPVGPPSQGRTPMDAPIIGVESTGVLNASIGSREVNYTLGEYVPTREIEEAFGLKGLARPGDIAPNQPYPHKPVYKVALVMLGAAILAGLLAFLTNPNKKVVEHTFVAPAAGSELVSSPPFQLSGLRNVKMTFITSQVGQWAYVDGQLFNEDTKKATRFTAGVQQSQAGPRRKRVKYLSALPKGNYTLQAKLRFQSAATTTTQRTISVEIRQGCPRFRNWFWLFLLLSVVPVGVGIHQLSFEARRWSESDYNIFSGG